MAFKKIEPFLTKIYCITPGVEKFVKELYGASADKIDLLPLAADDEVLLKINFKETRMKIRRDLHVGDSDIVVIHGGKLDKNKKTVELIEAILRMPDNVHLVIFGASEKEYENQINDTSCGNPRIHIIGWLNSVSAYSYFTAADIACFPGRESALWQQAIASGLPLVCKYWNGAEYLDVGGNILFLPEGKPALIFNALTLLLNNKELTNNMSEVAKTKGRTCFSYQRIAEKVIHDLGTISPD